MQPWPTPSPSSSSWSSNDIHHNNPHHYQPQPYDQNFNNSQNNFHYHHNSNSNVHGNHYFDHNWNNSNGISGHPPVNHQPLSGRKRNWCNSNRGALPDRSGGDRFAKLYVSEVPRTATEGVIRPVFEPYGNIVEVVLLRDKRTGLQQGSCFVKYASTEEADAAIQALSYKHTFPGERMPVTVKYADGRKERQRENERPGPITAKYAEGEMERQRENERPVLLDKLFVASLNKLASMKEIEEIFSPYGLVEDIYIVCDDMKQSRGIAFVKFSQREMALAAMTALNGNYIMRGCLTPLVVRFADAKKPRTGESRVNNVYNSTSFDFLPQQQVARPMINSGDSIIGQNNQPNASCTVQHLSFASVPKNAFSVANQEPQCFGVKQQPLSSSEKLPQTSSQLPQNSQISFEAFQIEDSLSQQPSSEAALCGNDPHTVASDPHTIASDRTESVIVDSQIESLECDWSEHTCPDGYKYYYNCTTFESRWDKPEQYALFQQQLKQQREPQSSPEVAQRQVPLSSHLFHQNLQPQASLTVQ